MLLQIPQVIPAEQAAKLRDREAPAIGARVAVSFDPERLHWFDTDTELRIEGTGD